MENILQKIFLYVFVQLFFLVYTVKAQQDPLYSQYMFNIQAYNPAYAGSWDNLGLTLLSREQWVDFENNPGTQTITMQAPFRNNTIGAGLSLINDNIGLIKRMSLNLDYSFGIKLGQHVTWRLGLKGGFSNFQHNISSYSLIEENDPVFRAEPLNLYLPNFGVGTFLHARRFYLGFSVPKLMQNETGDYSNLIEMRHFSAIAGVVIGLARGIDLKPSLNARYRNNGPLVADANLSFLFADKFWIGATYRTSDDLELGFNTNVLIGPNLRIGYAYDLMRNSAFNSFYTGTHEIMLSFEFLFKKTHFTSPRYF